MPVRWVLISIAVLALVAAGATVWRVGRSDGDLGELRRAPPGSVDRPGPLGASPAGVPEPAEAPAGRGAPAAGSPSQSDATVPSGAPPTDVAPAPGARVSGVVTVDGHQPDVPLQLVLVDEEGARFLEDMAVFAFFDDEAPRATTDALGRFAFSGLAQDWSGALLLPMNYGRVEPASQEFPAYVRLGTPTEGLAIDLQRLQAIVGRIVSEDTGAPVSHAAVMLEIAGSEPVLLTGISDEAGRFGFGRQLGPFTTLAVTASDRDATLFRKVVLTPADIAIDHHGNADLGDLQLPPSRSVELLVVDRAGRPVEGATAMGTGESVALAQRTGPDGRLTVIVGADRGDALAVAAGYYWPTLVDIPSPDAGQTRVVLDPVNRFEVVLETESGEPPPAGFRVSLSADQPLTPIWDSRSATWMAPDETLGPALLQLRWGNTVTGEENFVLFAAPDSEGRALFQRLWPGRPMVLEIEDPSGVPLVTEDVRPFQPSESRTRTFTVAVPDGAVEGVVLGPDGQPVSGATVFLREGPEPLDPRGGRPASRRAETNPAGEFRVEGLREDRASLWIYREGLAPLLVDAVPVGGRPREYRLERGRRVTIHVVDETGAPVKGVSISHDLGYFGPQGWGFDEDRGDGSYVLADLPDTILHLRIGLDGRDVELDHDTNVPNVEVVVPVTGGLQIDWELPTEVSPVDPDGSSAIFDFLLVPVAEGEEPIWLLFWTDGKATGTTSFELVPVGAYQLYARRRHPDQSGAEEGRIRMQVILGPVAVAIATQGVARVSLGP